MLSAEDHDQAAMAVDGAPDGSMNFGSNLATLASSVASEPDLVGEQEWHFPDESRPTPSATPVEAFALLTMTEANCFAQPADETAKRKKSSHRESPLQPYAQMIRNDPEGLGKVFKVVSSGRSEANAKIVIKRRHMHGYRFHPSTVQDLLVYYQYCAMGRPPLPHFLFQLVAKLVQDSLEEDIVGAVWDILCNEFISPVMLTKDNVALIISKIAKFRDYGPPALKRGVFIWELDNPTLVRDPALLSIIQQDQILRKNSEERWSQPIARPEEQADALPEPTSTSQCPIAAMETSPIEVKDDGCAKARDRERGVKRQAKPNAKLSSFFSVVRRAAVAASESSGEYFQPFFAKPDQHLAPINAFEDCPAPKTPLFPHGAGRWGRGLCIAGSRRRRRCRCLGTDSKPVYLIAKLLQFHTNHRPAYFGTWSSQKPELSGKSPFRKAKNVDYDSDSDEDWGEDAEILDAESIAGSDEEEDDMEEYDSEMVGEDELNSEEGSAWVVPDGYISDDEGLGERDGLERKRSLEQGGEPKAAKRDPKRRYIEKSAIISDIFLQGVTPNIDAPWTCDARLQWMVPPSEEPHLSFDPWKGARLSGQETFLNWHATAADKTTKIPFDESMLPDLAKIANASSKSLSRLFEVFTAVKGRVSKRQFEFKLYQIAQRTKGESGRSTWILRPEYGHLIKPEYGPLTSSEQASDLSKPATTVVEEPYVMIDNFKMN